jgi:hypothetical protein
MERSGMVLALLLATAGGAAAQAPTCNLNGFGADELDLTVPDAAASDFDLGWKGKYHDFHVPGGATFQLCLSNCDTTTDPVCDVEGYAGGQSAAGRAFTPPIPVAIGTTAVCVVTTFQEPFATGTANVQTGDIDVVAHVSGDVYLTTLTAVCPACSGTNAGDAGTCVGGATPGAGCTTDEVITVQNATAGNPYRVSRDCLPTGPPISVAFPLTVTTGSTPPLAGLCPGQTTSNNCGAGSCGAANCTGAGNGSGVSQNCCTNDTTKRCFPDPLVRTGTVAAPTPAWPDTSYPKTSSETLVSAFCVPGAPGILGLGVNSDAGLPGPAAFVLPFDAVWTLDPSPTTTTTTTTVATTSTTLAGCTSGADCGDGDPCTNDVCTAGTCSNPAITGAAGVDCQLGQALNGPICADAVDPTLQAAITQLIGKARTAVEAFDAASAKKMKKLRKKAGAALNALLKKTNKSARKGKISAACQADITAEISSLRQLVAGL